MMGSFDSELQDLGSGHYAKAASTIGREFMAVEPSSEFNPAEAMVLARYFTNMDRPVFALRNLPEVVKGALFSRYSRTEKSLRRVLLDEFINEPDSGFEHLAGGATEEDM